MKKLQVLLGIFLITSSVKAWASPLQRVLCNDLLSRAQKSELQKWIELLPEADYGTIGGRLQTSFIPLGKTVMVRVTDRAHNVTRDWVSDSTWVEDQIAHYLTESERKTFSLWLARIGHQRRKIVEFQIIHAKNGPIVSASFSDTMEKITFTDFASW